MANNPSIGHLDKWQAIKDEFYAALGRFVIAWSELERSVKEAIGVCMAVTDYGLIDRIVAGEQFSALMTLFNSLFRYRVQEEKALIKLKAIRKMIEDDLWVRRNDLMHSHWAVSAVNLRLGTRIDKMSKRTPTGFAIKIDSPSVDSINKLTAEIGHAQVQLRELMTANTNQIRKHAKSVPKFPTILMLHGDI